MSKTNTLGVVSARFAPSSEIPGNTLAAARPASARSGLAWPSGYVSRDARLLLPDLSGQPAAAYRNNVGAAFPAVVRDCTHPLCHRPVQSGRSRFIVPRKPNASIPSPRKAGARRARSDGNPLVSLRAGSVIAVVSPGSSDRRDSALVVCQCRVLPSAQTIGYTVSFYAKRGEPDGWSLEAYSHIRGLARLPESTGTQEQRTWQSAVVRRLRRQGVEVLSSRDADAYEKVKGRLWSLVWRTPILRYILLC